MELDSKRPPLEDSTSEDPEAMFSRRGCFCFCVPWSGGSGRDSPSVDWWDRVRCDGRRSATEGAASSGGGAWWKRGLSAVMKVREWSETVAGPKWKTFIRMFNRNGKRKGGGWNRFQYDPTSYSLNFDEGGPLDESPDREGFRDFSSRFALLPPSSAKSSMDLGGSDAPPLFALPEGTVAVAASAAGH